MRVVGLVCALIAPVAQAQRFDTLTRDITAPRYAAVAQLVPEVTIGGEDAMGDEYLFESIRTLLWLREGDLWLIDGRTIPRGKPSVRRYDSTAKFLGNVGRAGDGPGEWRSPNSLHQMRDGRVVLHDGQVGRPLTFYEPTGRFDTTWAMHSTTVLAVRADSSGFLWARTQAGVAFRSTQPFASIRFSPSGRIVDTIADAPPLPRIEPQTMTVTRGSSWMRLGAPYRTNWSSAWSPHGYEARYLNTRYAFDLLLPRTLPNGTERPWRQGDRVRNLRGHASVIPVSEGERADQRDFINARANAHGGTRTGSIPEVPKQKPLIKSIRFDLDGRIWASVSQPSERFEPPPPPRSSRGTPAPMLKWREPTVYDVIEPDGTFLGKVAVPFGVSLTAGSDFIQARGNRVWGVATDDDGVESVKRFRITWQ